MRKTRILLAVGCVGAIALGTAWNALLCSGLPRPTLRLQALSRLVVSVETNEGGLWDQRARSPNTPSTPACRYQDAAKSTRSAN